MVKLSRIFILLLVILMAAVTLPHYYRISFGKRVVKPMINFSPVTENFLVGSYSNSKFRWTDTTGKEYSRAGADSLLPFSNYRLLLAKGVMPDSLQGKKINIDTLRYNNLFIRLRPKEIDAPGIKMFPLFESKPARLKLTMPKDFVRFNSRMEFVNARKNTVEEAITERFTSALTRQGFTFPGIKYFGNPSTRKAFDEGWFVVDAAGKFFHIKKIRGKPYCRNIPLPAGFKVRHMVVYENALREFYGMLINEKNEVFLLLYDQYKLQQIPAREYDALKDQLVFRGDLFYRLTTVVKDRKILSTVVNRRYRQIAAYEQEIPDSYGKTAAVVQRYLFPFRLRFSTGTTYFQGFYFSAYSFTALWLNLVLMISLLFLKRYRGRAALNRWYDLILVLLSGIYGFIAVLVYENTDF